MIRKTLKRTKDSTWMIRYPSSVPEYMEFPIVSGTGFFVHEDGYFITANHVIKNKDVDKIQLDRILTNYKPKGAEMMKFVTHLNIIKQWDQFDIALLKVDLEKNADSQLLLDKKKVDYLDIDYAVAEEGLPVYSFGFPLSNKTLTFSEFAAIGFDKISTRVTSAIISAQQEYEHFPSHRYYVIDKALNYGNSGGPIISTETGKVIAICSSFQPVYIPQQMYNNGKKMIKPPPVMVPSLYGVVSALFNLSNELPTLLP